MGEIQTTVTEYSIQIEFRILELNNPFFQETLAAKDFIYKSNYAGWYATIDEAFYPEFDTAEVEKPDGTKIRIAKISGSSVEWVEEENYMFRLGRLRERLIDWHKSTGDQMHFYRCSNAITILYRRD